MDGIGSERKKRRIGGFSPPLFFCFGYVCFVCSDLFIAIFHLFLPSYSMYLAASILLDFIGMEWTLSFFLCTVCDCYNYFFPSYIGNDLARDGGGDWGGLD